VLKGIKISIKEEVIEHWKERHDAGLRMIKS
jgi:hypothetical protein